MRDEGGPLEAGLQGQASSYPELLGSRALVVSVRGKGAARLRHARIRKTNVSEPLITCRKQKDDAKTRPHFRSGMSPRGACVLLGWRPAWRRRDPGLGSHAERGNLSSRWKGRNPSGRTARVKVPMRGTGAEQPVVAVKPMKVGGAKGLRYPAWLGGQPDTGRSR